ncbi:hypothetical protein B9Z55_019402 [Caenorhabditis nigoni]|nr:hypothetical protein B9Z55_019402 [Caenorhabditis nigoni]
MKQEKLPLEFDKIMEIRKKTVLISFGTIMLSKDMPEDYKINILNVIESFPEVTFIWKYESDTFEEAKNTKNLYLFKWIPQTALLADSRLHVFITHAGLGSVNELSYMGKPALLVPLYADQSRNAKMLERHKGAISIDKKDLANFECLRNTFADVLNNQSYKKHAELLARQLELQPITPQELLLKHATFGAEFGELPSLDPYSREMSFFTFFMIDVYLFLFCSFVVSFYILFVVVRFLSRWMFRQQNQKQKTT